MSHPMRGTAAGALFLVVLAGCGGGGGGKKTTSTTSSTPTSAPASPTTTVAPTTTSRPPDLALKSFKTPSGNVGCMLDVGSVRCDIRDHAFSPPPKPGGCDLDWGDAVEVSSRSGAEFVCHGDTALDPSAAVLPYGQRTRQGSIVCESAESGVTCTNEASGHGFALSRERYRLS